jgi:hypothetical protein
VDGTPSSNALWLEGTVQVTVSDGRLTISNAAGSKNNKLAFVEIAAGTPAPAPTATAAPTNMPTSAPTATLAPTQAPTTSAPAFQARINFQPTDRPIPNGYQPDSGAAFGDRGNGLRYGWTAANTGAQDRNNAASPDQRYDTLIHMQYFGRFTWEIKVPNGTYDVHLVAGDPKYFDSVYRLNAENALILEGTPNSAAPWVEGTARVTVTDGRLTITNASGSVNNKLAFVEIVSAAP